MRSRDGKGTKETDLYDRKYTIENEEPKDVRDRKFRGNSKEDK